MSILTSRKQYSNISPLCKIKLCPLFLLFSTTVQILCDCCVLHDASSSSSAVNQLYLACLFWFCSQHTVKKKHRAKGGAVQEEENVQEKGVGSVFLQFFMRSQYEYDV